MSTRIPMPPKGPSGAKTRLFGVVLVFLGMLDSLLSWRGGMTPGVFHVLLIVAGLSLYFIGAVRRRTAIQPRNGVQQ